MQTEIAKELVEEYRQAEYLVPERRLVFRVDEPCEGLREWAPSFAFITAFNPYSEMRSEAENREAHERLRSAVERYPVMEAAGTDPKGNSPREDGWLIGAISLEEASEVGRQFRQNAILWAGLDAVPRLILLR